MQCGQSHQLVQLAVEPAIQDIMGALKDHATKMVQWAFGAISPIHVLKYFAQLKTQERILGVKLQLA